MPLSNTLTAVQYFTENDGYHYTIDNRPLRNLADRDVALANAIDNLATNSGSVTLDSVAGTNTLTARSPTQNLTSYGTGTLYKFTSANPNTGPVTLSIDSIMAESLVDNMGAELQGGAIPGANYICLAQYDGTNFVLLNTSSYKEIIQKFSGRLRTMTPAGGALVREWSDITTGTVLTTTGAIEYGVSYNCNIEAGNWLGRDIADICWISKWSDVGGTYEIWQSASDVAGSVPTVWTLKYKINPADGSITATGQLIQQYSGITRTMTPPGGALIREMCDVTTGTVASTTGAIEYGISYNCSIDTGNNWVARDLNDICWLEKWSDAGGLKEYWYAPSTGTLSIPAWTKVLTLDVKTGDITSTGKIVGSNIGANQRVYKATRGNITAGTTSLVVSSSVGYAIGDSIVIWYAGVASAGLTTTITNIVGNTITVANAASTTVANSWVQPSASASFTVPAGVTKIFVEMWGGGGGGGSCLVPYLGSSGGGGGAGGYGKGVFTVTPGQVLAVAAAVGGFTNVPNYWDGGNTGGTSLLGSLMSCTGGSGGASVYGGSGGGFGGSCVGGNLVNETGGSGHPGHYVIPVAAGNVGGTGGGEFGGHGSGHGGAATQAGLGSGGGGGGTSNLGAYQYGSDGGPGCVIISW